MLKKKSGTIEWLEFELLNHFPRVSHKLFLKNGGNSLSSYASLNMSFHCGDNMDAVKRNRELAGIDSHICGYHIHGTTLTEVNDTKQNEIPNCDGLMTRVPNVGLLSTHADCQTALFYDPINHVIANIHCGWRGNVQNIYGITIETLKARFGSKPENLHVGIGPSLGPNNAQFINYKTELPESFWDFQIKDGFFDLWEISRMQLRKAGVEEKHIEIAGICTFEEKQDFFSYRRDKICGRHATSIVLN